MSGNDSNYNVKVFYLDGVEESIQVPGKNWKNGVTSLSKYVAGTLARGDTMTLIDSSEHVQNIPASKVRKAIVEDPAHQQHESTPIRKPFLE